MRKIRFLIPIKLEDLNQADGQIDVYSVRLNYNLRDIPTKLNDCSDNFRSNGIQFILEDFDVFFYCLKYFDSLEAKHRDNSWKLIHKSLNKLYSDLENYFNNFDANERNDYCNLLKMIVYVFCSLSELFEEQDIKQSTNIDFDNIGAKKTNKKKGRTEESYDWQQNKDKGMSVLLRMMSLPLHRLFNPPVVEDEFVSVIMKCCYKMIENPIISRQKDSNFALNIFHIIGSGIERHRQSLSFCLKLIQLLQQKEQLVPILANLVEAIVKKHNQKLLICEIIREIKRIDIRELSRDSSGPKAISNFLVEVSEKCPQEMLPSISDLLDFLEEDSYLMRNATLSIIGNLVVKELSKSEFKEGSKERHLRDQLLDKLEDHIHDNTSYTRSRALLVWCNLCQAEVIPLPRLESLIEAVVGRLRDKSCLVRKYAVQFLTQFLTRNPFAAKLSLQVLKTHHQIEENKLKDLIAFNEENEQQFGSKNKSSDKLIAVWNDIETEFLQYWTESETATPNSCDDETDEIENQTILSNCEEIEEVFDRIRSLLLEKKFKSAVSLLKKTKDQFPGDKTLNKRDVDAMDDSSSEEDSDKEDTEEENEPNKTIIDDLPPRPPLPEIIALAKRIFLANATNEEKSVLDLGSKVFEKDIERLVTGLIQSSQETNFQTTTTVEVARPSIDGNESVLTEINKQQFVVKYLSDCIKFTQQIQISIPLVSELLLSRNMSDVQEAIEFFVSAYQFGVKEAIYGVRKLIILIWSQEKSVREAAISAYKRIYLDFESEDRFSDSSDKNSRQKAFSVIKSLSELVLGAALGELISIEQLLKELMDSNDITNTHIQILWERFAMKLSNTTPEESRAAIQLIGMLANSNPELIRSEMNLNAIIETALGERGRHDSRLVTETCIALGKAYRLPKTEKAELFFRLPKNHILFEKLSSLLIDCLDDINDNNYNMMSDTIIKVIFLLAENPDYLCEQLIKKMLQKMLALTQSEELTNEMQTISLENQQNKENTDVNQVSIQETTTEIDGQSIVSSQPMTEPLFSQTIRTIRQLNSEILSRFISMIGNIALNALIHIDLNVLTELKIRNHIKEEKDKKSDKTPRRRSKTPGKTPGTVAGDQNLEEEIGLAGANAVEDQEQEYLNKICNDELVLGNNLLARLSELVVIIAQDPVAYPDIKLRTASSLTLAKYMCVSENFCRLHIRLLFTIMEKSDLPVIRANTVIAVGDLCVRFPNLLDQWSPQMFQRLRDPDVTVKMNTLKVLSRLILSDMVKVKGQISEIAVLMVHENEILASSSRLFFTELGKKQNAIYNVLPDIISHLSDTETRLEEDDFRVVMKFIFELIDKSRQTVCLVEKLCQRFRMTTDERQWRDLAFCLSLLNYATISFQKLHENLICFADKLFLDEVHDCIQTIISNARKMEKTLKNETKQMIDEFEQKVNECRNKGTNEDDSEFQKVVGTPPSASKRTSRLSSAHKRSSVASQKRTRLIKPNKVKRKVVAKGSEEDDTDEDTSSNKRVAPQSSERRAERPQRTAKRLQPIISSEEESS